MTPLEMVGILSEHVTEVGATVRGKLEWFHELTCERRETTILSNVINKDIRNVSGDIRT